ncbi:FecR family protein [Pedobacter nutrimenti]|uniref:FecR family protein n=1 Tax=Pedobacter nutrimenti TaxID=1241337 RepID=UPI0029301187|nr:FecR domain-containing protein [Pedobacter nutrimenti]
MTNKEFRDLAIKCEDGTATETERERFNQVYDFLSNQYKEWDPVLMKDEETVKDYVFELLSHDVQQFEKRKKQLSIYKYIGVAASILILGIAVFYTNRAKKVEQVAPLYANDVAPGGNKAFLVLSNGKRLALGELSNGTIARQSGIKVTKKADGQLIYTIEDHGQTRQANEYNTIETPKGGQYEVRLPDGTIVWLNSASTLKYPVSFAAFKERKVLLKGEAYFEVAKDSQHPFTVKSDRQTIEVLGTHFNVNTYPDEPLVKTTLLEGSVKVSSNNMADRVLKPGQQADLSMNGELKVSDVDTELSVAWKNKQFMFESEKIETIMRMIERWYNVEVEYTGEKTEERFGGSVSRFDHVSKVLKSLESTGKVHFKIQGRKIYVSR